MGGLLNSREQDTVVENDQAWQVVTERQPTPAEKRRLELCLESSQACKIKTLLF